MGDQVDFEMVLRKAVQVPLVGISREQFLRRELSLRYNPDTVEKAIQYCPAYAGIPVEQISPIADACISYETNHVSMISAAAGIPGGLAMAGTIPADMIQYTAHLLRIMQKLAYPSMDGLKSTHRKPILIRKPPVCSPFSPVSCSV